MREIVKLGAVNQKMSSREIAELMEKEHKNVLRDIKALIEQGAIAELSFELSEYKDGSGKSNPMYLLDFNATMVLITGYDAKRRAVVIKRWLELETGEALPAYQLPATYAEALRALADESEKSAALQKQIEIDRPKVDLASRIEKANSIGVDQFVKSISGRDGIIIGRNNFYAWMRAEKLINRKNLPYQDYIDCGWFEVRESTYENKGSNGPRACFTTLVTGSGQVALFERLKKSKVIAAYLNKKSVARNASQSGLSASA